MSVKAMKEVQLENQTVKVEKLKLGKYVEVFSVLDQIPQQLNELLKDGNQNSDYIRILPQLISRSLPEVIQVLEIASPLTKEEIIELDLLEVIDLVRAVISVNDLGRVYEGLKSLLSPKIPKPQKADKKKASTDGSTDSSTSSQASMVGQSPPS